MADEIQHDGAKVLAQITLTLIGLPNGQTNTNIACGGEVFTEINARFMLDKARAFMDDHWRAVNAPRVTPPNGQPIAQQIRRLIG